MPLVTAAVLAWTAGLLAGFTHATLVLLAIVPAVVLLGAAGRRDRIALGAIAAAGLAIGHMDGAAAAACASDPARARRWHVTLEGDAAPGAFVTGRTACGARVRMAVEQGRAAAGSRVAVVGEPIAGRAGLVVKRARVRATAPPGRLPRWRASLGRGIDANFGGHAPLVRALLIADMRELQPAVRERFAAAGLSHMLSVSGLHVGLIAVAVSLVAQVAGLARARRDILVVGVTALYVAVIGAPLPAVRAAAMLGAVSLSATLQRPTSAWAILAVSAIVPLLDPSSATDLGFQLSMVGMVALVSSGVLVTRLEPLRAPGWRGALLRGLVTSVMATLLTTPLVAATFGRISLVAPVTNLVAVPVMAVLQPMLFLVLLLLPAGSAARFVADAAHPLLAAIGWIADVGARLPGASIPAVSDGAGMILAHGACVALVLACVTRVPTRMLVLFAACVAALAWRPLLPAGAGWTELHMLDVGQGDAIALRTMRGRWVLFDAGRDWQGGDAGRRDVVPYLAARGGVLDGFVLSHPHSDHVGGAASVIQSLRPRWYADPGYPGSAPAYRASLVAAREARTSWRRALPGDSAALDEAVITFLAPDSLWAASLRDPNDASLVARVRIGEVTILLAGDAEAAEERWLLAHQRALLDVDVLKVAHHGSGTSSTGDFLRAVTPRLALVSVGAGNLYRHPSADVLRSLAAHGAVVLRTDQLGTVVVRTDGARIEVEAGGERWLVR